MKICLIHNFYQQPGGEDQVFFAEKKLLAEHDHEVVEYTRHNDEIHDYSLPGKMALMPRTIYNGKALRDFRKFVAKEKPDILHFHNTFPLISPAAYLVGREARIPVIQTLHNYRLFCPSGVFYRDGRVCEDCFGKTIPWPGVRHACYRESRVQTLAVAGMLAFHKWRRTWLKQVDCFIALTNFEKQKFIQAGFPETQLAVKPNFLPDDPGKTDRPGDYAIFVGRLSPEKGLRTLMKAWQSADHIPLKIIGDGPLRVELEAEVKQRDIRGLSFLGRLPREEAIRMMKGAYCLIFPSEWYETFGLVAVEAFACGVPVIASRLGVMAEIVSDHHTGLHFLPGDATDLAEKVLWASQHPGEMAVMGLNARKEYEVNYTPQKNYARQMEIYQKVLLEKKKESFNE